MDATQTAQLAEIASLLAERRKIEQWITTLESRRDATPAHVYARVHADYSAKYDASQLALQDKMDAVRAVAHSLEQALEEQDATIGQRRDVRAEAELRALVGEYTQDEWDRRRSLLDDELSALLDTRAGVERELEVMRELLSEAQPGFIPATLPVVAAPHDTAPAPLQAEQDSRPVAPVAPVALAELDLHTGWFAPVAASVPVETAPAGQRDEITFLRSVLARSTPAVPIVAPAPVEHSASIADRIPEPNQRPLSAPAPNTVQAVRTLVCQECKAMNFPTEWYCEKCGGELAAY
ncbi:MAG: hypothetical protein NTU67_07235 [Gemmatimonadetes bacterium]|nr:hypothetical protein [Gemmatimonadota bacterium]